MQRKFEIPIFLITLLLMLGMTSESFAQRGRTLSRDPILMGNPRRDAGGSCVYNRQGQVVFAPAGKTCRDREDHLSELGAVDTDLVDSFPPRMRSKLTRLLSDHGHIAKDMARLRFMIREEKPEEALEVADKINSELTDHSVREEKFFKAMGRPKASR